MLEGDLDPTAREAKPLSVSVAFGFDADCSKQAISANTSVERPQRYFFGDDPRAQLEEVSRNCTDLGVEIGVLLKSLQHTLKEAVQVSEMNVETFAGLTGELEKVSDANIKCAEDLVERTLALSLELQELDGLKAKVDGVENSLKKYERLCEQLLTKQTRRKR